MAVPSARFRLALLSYKSEASADTQYPLNCVPVGTTAASALRPKVNSFGASLMKLSIAD